VLTKNEETHKTMQARGNTYTHTQCVCTQIRGYTHTDHMHTNKGRHTVTKAVTMRVQTVASNI
jgi:hypothetical protein